MDPVAITQTIALVKKAIQTAGKLQDLEIKDALIAAREALNDQREANLALKDKNHELKEENRDLKGRLEKDTLITPGIDCYEKDLKDGRIFAICSKCWETDGAAVTLVKIHSALPCCPNCQNYYSKIDRSKYVNLS